MCVGISVGWLGFMQLVLCETQGFKAQHANRRFDGE